MFNRYSLYFKTLVITAISVAFYTECFSQPGMVSLNSSKDQQWKVKPQAEAGDGSKINAAGYDTKDWVQAIVPGTVFSSYVAAGLEKDPNFGDNIYKVDKAKYDRNFWYRTEFNIPADFSKSKIWLNFRGVNRKADIYLNGIMLGTLDWFICLNNLWRTWAALTMCQAPVGTGCLMCPALIRALPTMFT